MLIALTFFTCAYLNAKAQVDESRNFVYLYSGSVIYGKNIRLRHDFFNSLQLRVDSKPITLQKIKFFKNDEGFFANTKGQDALGQIRLSQRIIAGKINLYQERPYTTFLDHTSQVHNERGIKTFYNKGYGDLKKANYNNLKIDMADHAESMDLLENYRKNVNTSNKLYIAAGASAVASLVTFLVGAKDDYKQASDGSSHGRTGNLRGRNGTLKVSMGLFGVGAGLAIGGYSTNRSGLRKLEGAFDAYNK